MGAAISVLLLMARLIIHSYKSDMVFNKTFRCNKRINRRFGVPNPDGKSTDKYLVKGRNCDIDYCRKHSVTAFL